MEPSVSRLHQVLSRVQWGEEEDELVDGIKANSPPRGYLRRYMSRLQSVVLCHNGTVVNLSLVLICTLCNWYNLYCFIKFIPTYLNIRASTTPSIKIIL